MFTWIKYPLDGNFTYVLFLVNTCHQERTQKDTELCKRADDIWIEIWINYMNWQYRWKWTFCHIAESQIVWVSNNLVLSGWMGCVEKVSPLDCLNMSMVNLLLIFCEQELFDS